MKIQGCKRTSYIESAMLNGGQSIFYLLKCWDKNECFYKLGITVNHILTRYASPRSMPYDFEILLEIEGTAEDVYDMEVKFKEQMNKYHYLPSTPFNGSKTECYSELSHELSEAVLLDSE